jgi:glycosyltransferase involved in cell wall biosynthesis
MNPRVSVILLNYNQGEFLASAIESVIGQTFTGWELLVVDNGSTDDSVRVAEKYLHDPRVKLIDHRENRYPSIRANEAVKQARGEFISLLYADDYYLPNKLERQLKEFERLDPEFGVVYSLGARLYVETGAQKQDLSFRGSGWVLKELLRSHGQGFVNPISPLVKTECFRRYPYDETLFIEGESINLFFAMKYKYQFIPEVLVVMRDHSRNEGKNIRRNMVCFMQTLERLRNHPDFPNELSPAVTALQAECYRRSAWQGIRVLQDNQYTRECVREAARRDGSSVLRPKIVTAVLLSFLPSVVQRGFNGLISSIKSHT